MSNQEPMDGSAALEGLNPADLLKQGAAEDTIFGNPPPFSPPSLEELARIFPQFEILELIGRGGMGAVYKVRQRELDRLAALKILPPAIGEQPGFAERFTREARALAKLNHPGIVTLYEFGQADGLYFFLMELVDGANLRQLLRNGRIAPREAMAIVPQICDALQFAHDHGIVHRDIKPENILLDRRGRVKVADFGIAKLMGAETDGGGADSHNNAPFLTESGKVMGTPDYMAPEQTEHPNDVDHRADIYALGVVFYQMLTGELPDVRIEPPSHKVMIDVRLDEVVLRALEKTPELRYQHVSQVKTMVETIIGNPLPGGGQSEAHPPTVSAKERSGSPATRFDPREKIFVIGGTVIFSLILLVLFGIVLAYPRQAVAPMILMGVCLLGLGVCGLRLAGLWPFPTLWFPRPNFSARNLSRKCDGNRGEAGQVETSEIVPRFSHMAIVGACWPFLVFAILVVMASALTGLETEQTISLSIILSVIGTTNFGWIAVSQIRSSAGRLRGMWLAVLDGLLPPLLTLDVFVGVALHNGFGIKSIADGMTRHAAAIGHDPVRVFVTVYNSLVLLALAVVVVANGFIVRKVWRAVNSTTQSDVKPMAYTALFFGVLSNLIPIIFYWNASAVPWITPQIQQTMLGITLVVAALAMILGNLSRAARVGWTALVLGGISLTIWMLCFISGMVSGSNNASKQREVANRNWAVDGIGRKPAARDELGAKIAANPLGFGPVVELDLPFDGKTLLPKYLSFERGMIISPPDMNEKDDFQQWLAQNSVDAAAQKLTLGPQLFSYQYQCVYKEVESTRWLTIRPEEVVAELQTGPTAEDTGDPKPLSTTFLFKTRKGGMGIVQMLGISDKPGQPRGVTIHYKMVGIPNPATPPQPAEVTGNMVPPNDVSSAQQERGAKAALVFSLERGGPMGGVDLDTGKFVNYVPTGGIDDPSGAARWREDHGIDLILDRDSASPGVLLTGTQVMDVAAEWWDNTPEAGVVEAVLPPWEKKPQFDERMTFLAAEGPSSGTKTHVFRTLAGSVGILRLGPTFSAGGVRAEWRMIVDRHPAEKATESPQLRRLDWQDQVEACTGDAWLPSGEVDRSNDWMPPIISVNMEKTKAAKETPRFLCLWFSHPLFDAQSLMEIKLLDSDGKEPLKTPTGNIAYRPIPAAPDNANTGWITATLCVGNKGQIPPKATVNLRYSVGAWQFWTEIAPDFRGTKSLADGVMLGGPGQSSDGNSFIQITKGGSADEQFDFVAITLDGRRLERTGHGESSSGKVVTERFSFTAPLSQVKSFECRKRPIHRMSWPVVLKETHDTSGKMKIDFDRAGDSMQNILYNFSRKYDVRLCFENLDFDMKRDTITLGRRISLLEEKQHGGKLTEREAELLKDARRLRKEEKLEDETVIDVGERYEGNIVADSVEDFLNQLTKDTPYDWTNTDGKGTWVVLPRAGTRLNYLVTLDTADLTVEEAVAKVIEQRPAGSEIGVGQVVSRPVAPGTDSDPWLHVKCKPAKIQGIPAWRALSVIGEGARPDSTWELAGYKEHRMLSLAPGPSMEMSIISEVQAWLIALDRGEYAKSWETAAEGFHTAVTKEQWMERSEQFRKPLGAVISRKVSETRRRTTFPGLPDGSFFEVKFDSSFAGQKSAVETVTFSLEEDGRWKAAGYFIR